MASTPTSNFSAAQVQRLKRFNCTRCVDMHCHILPGVDDGPPDLAASLALARMLVHDGITDVIATPHQLGRWDGTNSAAAIRQAASELQARINDEAIPLAVHPGGEVRLDERLPALLGSDIVLTLADARKHLLVELPPSLSLEPKMLVPFLQRAGMGIILAHAERYDQLASDPQSAEAWISQGVALQVNAMSLSGGSGEYAENAAWRWLERSWVSLLATDAHSTNSRRPMLSAAIDGIVERIGADAAHRVCIDNPLRVLEGRELV